LINKKPDSFITYVLLAVLLKVAKKLSATALLWQFPRRLIEGSMYLKNTTHHANRELITVIIDKGVVYPKSSGQFSLQIWGD